MATSGPQKRKPRSRIPKAAKLTPEFVFACGKLFCTQEEIGDLCGLSQQYISEVLNSDPELLQAFRMGRAQGKMSLRRAQAKKAIQEGNMVAQIWLGKQELGQSDKQETHETQDLNITVQYVAKWGAAPHEIAAQAAAAASISDQSSPDNDDVIDSTATEEPDSQADPPVSTES